MASATKSIQLVRSPQRIPTEKLKRFDRSEFGAVWTLIYAFAALLLVTTAIVVGLCLSLSNAARNERFDWQSKS
jgi:hypothetical protein